MKVQCDGLKMKIKVKNLKKLINIGKSCNKYKDNKIK